MKAWWNALIAGAAIAVATIGQADAQVRYAPQDRDAIDFFSPYDESYGTSPSFQIYPAPNGAPAVRVVEHCQYPDGWNVTDFSRDVNGIPNGLDHECPAPVRVERRRRR